MSRELYYGELTAIRADCERQPRELKVIRNLSVGARADLATAHQNRLQEKNRLQKAT